MSFFALSAMIDCNNNIICLGDKVYWGADFFWFICQKKKLEGRRNLLEEKQIGCCLTVSHNSQEKCEEKN